MKPLFSFKGESLEEYWNFTKRALTWPDGGGPDLIVDDGGDATLFLHRGYYAEKDPSILDKPADNKESAIVDQLLRETLASDPGFFARVVERWRGVSEETTTGVHRLSQMLERGELLVGDQVQVRQHLRLPPFVDRRH